MTERRADGGNAVRSEEPDEYGGGNAILRGETRFGEGWAMYHDSLVVGQVPGLARGVRCLLGV